MGDFFSKLLNKISKSVSRRKPTKWNKNQIKLDILQLEERITPATLPGFNKAQQIDEALKQAILNFNSEKFNPTPSREVVIIDSSLIASIPQAEFAGSLVVPIDNSRDVVDQISTALNGLEDVSVLRVISHGSDGRLWFGNQSIDSATLASRSIDISAWGQSLTAESDILLYGCSVASTDDGRRFVEQFASLTHSDIAASTNLTGNSKYGGDWVLEFHTGEINTASLKSQSFVGTLSPTSLPSLAENSGANQIVYTAGMVDGTTYSLGGVDSAYFSINASTGAVALIASPDYEAKNSYGFSVIATLGAYNTSTEQFFSLDITDVNEAPTVVALTNTTTTLPENTSTSSRIKVADIGITDDALGANVISLTGTDAGSFEVSGTSLYLKAGVALNFESKASYAVTVSVLDSGISGSSPVTVDFSLAITDVNEAPTVIGLTNTTTTLPENTSTSSRIKVADIGIADDALGSNAISLTGTDAASFEVSGAGLYLKAGVALNYESKTSYAVTVSALDSGVSGSTPVTVDFSLAITDVNEAPVLVISPSQGNLVEAGGIANAISGTPTASMTLTATDPEGQGVNFNITYLTSNGWSSADSGITYSKAGTYGTATFTITSGVITYTLDNSASVTQALTNGLIVTDTFTVQAVDDTSISSTINAVFSITGANDSPNLVTALGLGSTSSPDQTKNGAGDWTYTVPANAFADVDSTLSYTATLGNGGALPGWLTFNSTSRTFAGNPPSSMSGTTLVLKVTASDGTSSTFSVFSVAFVNVNDTPTLSAFSALAGAVEDTAFTITYAALLAASNAIDADNDVISFRIESVTSGTLTKGGVAVVTGTTMLAVGESLVWTPPAQSNGLLNAFTVKASDGTTFSATAVQVTASVAAVNDTPVIITSGSLSYTEAGAAAAIQPILTLSDADISPVDTIASARVSLTAGGTSSDNLSIGSIGGLVLRGSDVVYSPSTINILTNGSFEASPFTQGWTIVGNGASVGSGASDGSQCVGLSTNGGLSQTIATTAGTANYTLSYSIKFSNSNQLVNIYWGGAMLASYASWGAGWWSGSIQFSGTGGNVELKFVGGSLGGGIIDNIRLTVTGGTDVVMGTVDNNLNGQSGKDLLVNLNSNASVAMTQSLLRAVQFNNTSNDPTVNGTSPARTVTFSVTDANSSSATNGEQTAIATSIINITSTNSAPVLADTALSISVPEDGGVPVGVVGSLVSSLVGGITDADTSSVRGIAITASVETNGTWYYSTNGGTNWSLVGPVSSTSALLLNADASTRIYYNSTTANYYGARSAVLTFKAWDGTIGTASSKLNPGTYSATAAFSSATDTVSVSVTPFNDATVITTSGSLSYTEAGAAAAIQPSLTLADVDDAQITGGSISIANPVTGDILSFTNTGTITGIFSGGVLTLTGTDTLANYQAALRTVKFSSISSDPTIKGTRRTRTVTFSVTDANGSSGANGQQTGTTTSIINITAVNDAPTLTTFTVPFASTNEDIEVEITFANLLAQGDAADIDGTVNAFVIKAVSTGTIKIGTSAGVATAWNASSNATIDATKKAYWTPASNFNGTLNAFTAVAKDNDGLESATAVQVVVSVILVNDAPVITTSGSLSYTEAVAAAAIQPSLTLSDVDDTQITGGSISLTNPVTGDTLSFTNTGTITGIFSGGVLTLTGTDTLANYQAALREICFSSTSNDPTVNGTRPTRTVTFSVTDANGSSGANGQQTGTTTSTINITGTNSAPVLVDTALSITVPEDGGIPVGSVGSLISSLVGGITDADTSAVQGIAITASVETNGIWYFSTNSGTTWSLVGTVSSSSALLLFADASTRIYYKSTAANYNGTRSAVLTFKAWDGTTGTAGTKVNPGTYSATVAFSSSTDTIDVVVAEVNDAPSFNISANIALEFIWTARMTDSQRNWQSIVSSADGTKLAAVARYDYIYTSTDSGVTWTARMTDIGRSWSSIASSADGMKLAAVGFDGIYTSTDAGVTWTARRTDITRQWLSIASSADGAKLTALHHERSLQGGLLIYTSNDSGVNWTVRNINESDPDTSWHTGSLASSADGTKLAAVARNGYIYSSYDSGSTWTMRFGGNPRNWQSVAMSADGTKQVATDSTDIYTSSNSGNTWTLRTGTTNLAPISWDFVASSNDGTKLAAVSYQTGGVYTSADSGLTWNLTPSFSRSNKTAYRIASSADGTKLVITTLGMTVNNPSYIYTGALGVNVSVAEDSGAYSQNGFLTNISSGPSNESTQTVTFTITSSNPSLFSVAPAIDSLGNLTFTPAANANGAATITVVANDDGDSSNGGVSSSVAQTFSFVITDANDAPTVTAPASFTVIEDVVSNLLFTGTPFADVDVASGEMTVTLSVSDGVITGNAGTGITVAGTATARTFRGTLANLNTYFTTAGKITYLPISNSNVSRTLTIQINDLGNTGTGGSLVASTTSTINITPVNDAPLLSGSAPVFATIAEDPAESLITGRTVTSLVSPLFSDAADTVIGGTSANTLAGIAIIAYTENIAQGAWQYSTDAGATWIDISTVSSATSAITITASDLLRYAPKPDFNGAVPVLTFVAIENSTTVTSGAIVDASVRGGSTSFSSATLAITQTVTAVVDIVADSLSVNEDSSVTANLINGTNGASADNFENSDRAITAVTQGARGSVTFNADGTVIYTPTANWNGVDTFTYTVTSGGALETATVTVTVIPINDAPVATGSTATIAAINEGSDSISSNSSAVQLNGTSAYMATTISPLSNVTNFSISFWLKPGRLTGQQTLVAQNDAVEVSLINSGMYVWTTNSSGHTFDLSSVLTVGTWVHLVLTGDATADQIKVYANGTQVGTSWSHANIVNYGDYYGTPSVLMAGGFSGDGMGGPLQGIIDEISVWTVTKSASEVSALKTQPPSGSEVGLVGYWGLNEGTGTTVYNSKTGATAASNFLFFWQSRTHLDN
jgi:VCBS repeat-containing protein